ncbi:cytochrome P450 [Lentzea tibetensis]|uniref:Cytochrome P450 n=1 Tax=Lentzea tibetensis TaxID=2591470 RepID=A0A563EN27_9PSEU|nr:cytochrome P450 [Lentzea tibetensis]TWP48659.1 cytochrome P450 [Lentzea tibetensis]
MLDLTEVVRDPVAAYERAREESALARMPVPGIGDLWVVTRHAEARAVLSDPRFEVNQRSFVRPPGIPEHCLPYLRTMAEIDGPEHTRLRRAAAPAFTVGRANELRPRIARIVDRLLDELPAHDVDLLRDFARPLPIEVICEVVGIPDEARPRWREYGAAVASGAGEAFVAAIPRIIEDAKNAEHVLSVALSETKRVTLVWHLVLAGQTPTNLIANGVDALLRHPDQLAAAAADPARAVEELLRWCGPQLLTTPRYATGDVEVAGEVIRAGDPVTVAIIAANRDPRAFADAARFDVTRGPNGHLSFSHGPHFCLAASLARVETELAIGGLLRRFPRLRPAGDPLRAPDPGTLRLASLPVDL